MLGTWQEVVLSFHRRPWTKNQLFYFHCFFVRGSFLQAVATKHYQSLVKVNLIFEIFFGVFLYFELQEVFEVYLLYSSYFELLNKQQHYSFFLLSIIRKKFGDLRSISPIFYALLFYTKVSSKAFLYSCLSKVHIILQVAHYFVFGNQNK